MIDKRHKTYPVYTYRVSNVALSGLEPTLIVQANPKRKSVGFFSNCDFITISTAIELLDESQIILHSTAFGGLWFYDYQCFELVKSEWYAAVTGCPICTVIEIIKEK